MNSALRRICNNPVTLLTAAVVSAFAGLTSLQADESVQASQSAPLYLAGTPLEVSCSFIVPPGRSLLSLLWTPALPAGYTLVAASVTGDGSPEFDSEGAIAFLGDLSVSPVLFRYWITVPADATGSQELGGTADFALNGMFNPEPYTIPVITLSDAQATHALQGYLAGQRMDVECTFAYPAGRQLESLLWIPELPDGWRLVSAVGEGDPQVELLQGDITFFGDLSSSPVVFRYTVEVPAGTKGPVALAGQVEYALNGMFNPSVTRALPDPLVVPEMHTLEIVSAYGEPFPSVGVYTNFNGTVLTSQCTDRVVEGSRTFACAGWTMTANEPLSGIGTNCLMTLTNNAVLTWTWVAPLITPAGSVTVTMDEDNAPLAWVQPGTISAVTTSTPEGEPAGSLTWSLKSPAGHGTASVSGAGAAPTILYSPAPDSYGPDSFVVRAADGLGGEDTITVNVEVRPVNDAPVLAPIGDQRTDERTTLTFTAAAADHDLPSQLLTYTLDAPSIARGMSIDPVSGVFLWTPTEGQAGMDFVEFPVTVTVTDNGSYPDNLTDSETLTITLDSSRATHTTVGYLSGQNLRIDCTFAYPATGRQLQSLLWRPELPPGWQLLGAAGDGNPELDTIDQTLVFWGSDLPDHNPVTFSYTVRVPSGVTGPQPVGGVAEYLMNGMANPATVRAQPDPLLIPMLLTLPDLTVADKVYDSLTNATVVTYGSLAGVVPGDDVQLVTNSAAAYFDTPTAGTDKPVTVSGLMLTGVNADWYAIDAQSVTACVTPAMLTFTADAKTKRYGDLNPPLTFHCSGFVNGDNLAALGAAPTAATTVEQYTGAGTHVNAITLSGGADINYAFTCVAADFTITKAEATLAVMGSTTVYDGGQHGASGTVAGADGADLTALLDLGAQFTDVPGGLAEWSFAGDQNHNPAAGTAAIVIGKATLVIGGSFTAADKVYDGSPSVVINASSLTLLTPVTGDDLTLVAVAAFENTAVGAGKLVSLSAESLLTGADAANYTLSLDGAPTSTAEILFPAVSATQTCSGFRSPSTATAIASSFSVPADNALISLTWQPVLPEGWTLAEASGEGSPSVSDGSTIVFAGPFTGPVVTFTYTVAIPGNQAVTNLLNASVAFRLASMADALTAPNLPQPLLLKRYHSADCDPANWRISGREISTVKGYLNAGVYYVNLETVDGFSQSVGTQQGGYHSADYDPANWRVSGRELSTVKGFLNAGAYHVEPIAPGGYANGPE